MKDDADSLRALLQDYPVMAKTTLSATDRDELYNDWYTNYFYCGPSETLALFGLIVDDSEIARSTAKMCGIEDKVSWGSNQDPVQMCTVATIAYAMCQTESLSQDAKVFDVLVRFNDQCSAVP